MNEALRVAIVGAGPAGLYAAAELARQQDPAVTINVLDRLPSMGGLARAGVAPDHAERRLIIEATEKLARSGGRCEFFGNVELGRDVQHVELLDHHHAVIYASGAAGSRPLDVPGADLAGSWPSNRFVGWYNGHPDHAGHDVNLNCERAVVIGNGNVALDIARILLKSAGELAGSDTADHAREALANSHIREVVILGRRGPAQASFTHPELRELGHLRDVSIAIDRNDLDTVGWRTDSFTLMQRREILERYASRPRVDTAKRLRFQFMASPLEIHGDGRVSDLTIMHNQPDIDANGRVRAIATGQTERVDTGLIVHAIGYRAAPLPGVPFDAQSCTVPNDGGRVLTDNAASAIGTYVTGWLKRGPRGVIGSNKQCAAETVRALLADAREGKLATPEYGEQHFIEMLRAQQPGFVDYRGWKLIDRYEQSHADNGAPRRKLCSVPDMLRVARNAAS